MPYSVLIHFSTSFICCLLVAFFIESAILRIFLEQFITRQSASGNHQRQFHFALRELQFLCSTGPDVSEIGESRLSGTSGLRHLRPSRPLFYTYTRFALALFQIFNSFPPRSPLHIHRVVSSPGPWQRQREARYAIHASHQLSGEVLRYLKRVRDRKSTRLNSSHSAKSRMPSSA